MSTTTNLSKLFSPTTIIGIVMVIILAVYTINYIAKINEEDYYSNKVEMTMTYDEISDAVEALETYKGEVISSKTIYLHHFGE